ncbi:MAG TPA: hypothetical protein VFQ36_12955 [Ktedonobacteraceae bacterium]|nr:hypothetical protein [Ktedonobacteraceae bacterium]
MALANKSPVQLRAVRRIWKTPGSKWNWLFLGLSLLTLGWVYWLYRNAIAVQLYPGPYNAPFRQFGVVAFVLVLAVAAYTLRRRFVRSLPGKVQSWLWLHVWFGIISVLIAGMHENFQTITHDLEWTKTRFTEYYFGTSALFALILLVVTGVIGRLFDRWQARVIAAEADTNGVGINRSVQERLFELSLQVERLSAGKSAPFQQFCQDALQWQAALPTSLPVLNPREVSDFQQVYEILSERALLGESLRRQQHARLIIRMWRYIHISLACLAILVISFHSVIELWKWLVLHY